MAALLERVIDTIAPGRKAEAEYRRSVATNEFDADICDRAGRSPHDFRADRARYEKQQRAAEMLANIPSLRDAAEHAKAEAEAAKALPESLAEMGALAGIEIMSYADVARAAQTLQARADRLAEKARRAAAAPEESRRNAEDLIRRDCRVEPDPTARAIGQKIEAARVRMAQRDAKLRASTPERIRDMRSEVDALGAGRAPAMNPAFGPLNTLGMENRLRSLRATEKRKLVEALKTAGERPALEEAIQKDAATVADLERQFQEARDAHWERLATDPDCLAWSQSAVASEE